MNEVATTPNTRSINHRITAHRMRNRGQSPDAIADYLRVTPRSVHRYLSLPCPEPPPASEEVDLVSFVSKGACAAFPEVDWLSRSPLVQAEAKAICQYCPVLDECRSYGLNKGRDQRGVLGGMTMAERVHGGAARSGQESSPKTRGRHEGGRRHGETSAGGGGQRGTCRWA